LFVLKFQHKNQLCKWKIQKAKRFALFMKNWSIAIDGDNGLWNAAAYSMRRKNPVVRLTEVLDLL